MEAVIIYCSDYNHNTEKIARIFAEKLQCKLISIHDAKDINIDNYKLIGFGSGVYRESISPKLLRLVDKLPLQDKNVFAFSTSGAGMAYYNKRLLHLLEVNGAKVVGSFACKGSFTAKDFTDKKIFEFMGRLSQGHPNEKDYKKAEKFIHKIMNCN